MAAGTVPVNHVEFVAILLVAFQRLVVPEEIPELFTIRAAELITLYESGRCCGLRAVLHDERTYTRPTARIVIYRRQLGVWKLSESGKTVDNCVGIT